MRTRQCQCLNLDIGQLLCPDSQMRNSVTVVEALVPAQSNLKGMYRREIKRVVAYDRRIEVKFSER